MKVVRFWTFSTRKELAHKRKVIRIPPVVVSKLEEFVKHLPDAEEKSR